MLLARILTQMSTLTLAPTPTPKLTSETLAQTQTHSQKLWHISRRRRKSRHWANWEQTGSKLGHCNADEIKLERSRTNDVVDAVPLTMS